MLRTMALAAVLLVGAASSARAEVAGAEATGDQVAGDQVAGEGVAAPPEPGPGAEAQRLVVLFTSDLRAGLVDPGCGEGQDGASPLLPRISAAVRAERERAARQGEGPVVLLDAGDAMFPSPLVRSLAVEPAAARRLVQALRSAGYDALASGNTTVSAPMSTFRGFARAARELDLPLLAANIACDDESPAGSERCRTSLAGLTRRRVIVERQGLRVGVFSLLPGDIGERLARPNAEGTEIGAPLEAAREATRQLRAEGADIVVLLSHTDRSETAPRRTLELLSQLSGDEAPDLVVAASTAGLAIRIRTAEEGPPVLAVSGETLGRATLVRSGGRWELADADVATLPAPGDELLGRTLGSWRAGYCAEQARPLRGGALTGPMDADDFLHMLSRVMREQTRAEIGLLNQGMVSSRAPFPVEGHLTPADIRAVLPYDNELRVASIRGTALQKLAPRLLGAEGCAVDGLTKRGSTYYVNGRAVDSDARYRLVTIDFLAGGGDGLLEDTESLGFEAAEPDAHGNVMLADRVAAFLDLERDDAPYDPDERVDLHNRPLWYGFFVLDLSVNDTVVVDEAAYDQPQLSRQSLFDMRLGAEVRGGMSTRDHSWDNLLQLRYGRQRLETEVGSRHFDWGESSDLVNLRSSYTLDHVRNHLLDGAWYGPSFFVEYNLESEFDHDGDGPHFLEMTETAGLRLKPLSWLQLQLGAGIRTEVLADDAAAVPGLTVRAEVARRRFLGLPLAPIYLSALVDYFLSWPEAGQTHKLITEGRIEVQLWGALRLVGSIRMFMYQEGGGSVATAVDSTLGLGLSMSHRLQTF